MSMTQETLTLGDLLSTKEIMSQTKVARSTLFHWERKGHLKPLRDRRGWRLYSIFDLEKIKELMTVKERSYSEYISLLNERKNP